MPDRTGHASPQVGSVARVGGEGDLVARLRAGEPEAFAALVAAHEVSLLRLALSVVGNRAVAEEVVQDTWMAVLRGIERFEGRSSLRTWLFHIVLNRARSAATHEHRSVPLSGMVIDNLATCALVDPQADGQGAEDVDERMSAGLTAARIRHLLTALPAAQRDVVLLCDVEGRPPHEVAMLLGISDGYQRVLLHRGRQHLRTRLRGEGLGPFSSLVRKPVTRRSDDGTVQNTHVRATRVDDGGGHAPRPKGTTMTVIDQPRLEELMGRMVGYMTGGALCFGVWLGDELGIYRAMAGAGPLTADEVAEKVGCNPRLIREWLDGQTAGGLTQWDAQADRYELSPEGAMALADENSPTFVARGMNAFASLFIDGEKIAKAFRGDGAMSWRDHHECLFSGTEWFFRTGYRAELPNWIAALDGVEEKLRFGGTVADVGCGHGASVVVMAQNYPAAHITGFDFHGASVETAKQRAEEAGVADRVAFEQAEAKSYDGSFDLICFLDCLHDMGDPVGAARYAREHLKPDGTLLLVEPFALDHREANLATNPMAALLYVASSAICTPNSLSQEVGLGLGAQAGEANLRHVIEQAGFTRFRRVAETPMNLILEARA